MDFCSKCGKRVPAGRRFCPSCGHRAGQLPPPATTNGSVPASGIPQAIEAAITVSALFPYLQAFMTEAGKDSYAALSRLFAGEHAKKKGALADSSKVSVLTITDTEKNLALIVRSDSPTKAGQQIFTWLDHPGLHHGMISFNPEKSRWEFRGHGTVLLWDDSEATWLPPRRRFFGR